MTTLTFPLPTDTLQQFCRRWNIRKLALFGLGLRTDFRPDSDVERSPTGVRREVLLHTAQVMVSADEAGDVPR